MKKILIVLLLIVGFKYSAQDLLSAHIQTKWISDLTYSVTLTLLTDAAIPVSRPSAAINFGNGDNISFPLTHSFASNGVIIKTYSGNYTYANPGLYSVWFMDGYRIAGIKNITNSAIKYIAPTNHFVCNNFSHNTNPSITNPIYLNVIGHAVTYNPNCVDPDNDSLSYVLKPSDGSNSYIPANATLNAHTGELTFSKDSIGKYAFIIEITEWTKNTSSQPVVAGRSQIDFVMNIDGAVQIKNIKNPFENFSIFPNPFNHQFTIHSQNNSLVVDHLLITNMIGQNLFETKHQNVNQAIELNLPKGLYFLSFELNGQKQTYKVIRE